MKKKLCVLLIMAVMMFCGRISCIAANEFDSIIPEELEKEELVDAYNELRDTYNILFDLYVKELMDNSGYDSVESETETEKINTANRWIIKNYVDEFDRPTEEQYITNEYYITGTFSNSATTDSELKVMFLIDKDYIRIKLYEYGDNVVNNSYSKNKEYSLLLNYHY